MHTIYITQSTILLSRVQCSVVAAASFVFEFFVVYVLVYMKFGAAR